MDSDGKNIAMDATDAKILANATSRRPESNGRRPGPGFCQNSMKTSSNLILLTRAVLGEDLDATGRPLALPCHGSPAQGHCQSASRQMSQPTLCAKFRAELLTSPAPDP